jgi:sugar phosphate isomerase/epimerase
MNQAFRTTLAAVALFALTCPAGFATAKDEKQVGVGSSFKGPVGIQLYSLRDVFAKDVPGGLAQVRSFGIKYVELAGTYNLTPQQFREQLDAAGLVAVAGHFGYEQFRDKPEDIARDAKVLGLRYVGCAWIPHGEKFDEKTAREAIGVFNKSATLMKKHGLKFFFHTHGYEFVPHGDGTLFDLIMNETKQSGVVCEMDVFWVIHGGQDPTKLMTKYGSRFELMHVKDMKKGTETGLFTGGSDPNNDVVLGTGMTDWVALLRASRKAGVKWYFLEDESSSVVAQVPESLKYLEQVKF